MSNEHVPIDNATERHFQALIDRLNEPCADSCAGCLNACELSATKKEKEKVKPL